MFFPLKDDNPSLRWAIVTICLIALNLGVWLWQSSLSPLDEQMVVAEHGFVPQRVAQLSNPNLVVTVPIDPDLPGRRVPVIQGQRVDAVQLTAQPGQIIASLLTMMFMHAGWFHVLSNMWFLWIFGNNIEDRLGWPLYLLFYLVGGLLATGCHWVYDPHSTTPVIGASGAVSTILGAYAVTFPKAKVKTLVIIGIITIIDMPALAWLALWFGGQLVDAFWNRDLGVAVWAHIGGFAAGALLMPLLSLGSVSRAWQAEFDEHFSTDPSQRS